MKNLKKIATIAGAAIVALLAIATYIALWTGSTSEIEAVADKFQPGEGWVMVSEQIDPPRMLCLGGNPCPHLSRSWKRDEALTLEEFEAILKASGWDFAIEDDCEINSSMSGSVSLCSSKGSIDNHKITITYGTSSANRVDPDLSILVREEI